MRSASPKKENQLESKWICGVLSKAEASHLILSGHPHIHSTMLGTQDPLLKHTLEGVASGKIPVYPWELTEKLREECLSSSQDRLKLIQFIIRKSSISEKRTIKERAEIVLEELLTNAVYHAYQNQQGEEKYVRSSPASLKPEETVKIKFAAARNGIYLSVTDNGGHLSLEQVGKALTRCYCKSDEQIQNKVNGAGLGFYLIFEAATHVKFINQPGVSTTISCWLSSKSHFDSRFFSFNFFTKRGES